MEDNKKRNYIIIAIAGLLVGLFILPNLLRMIF